MTGQKSMGPQKENDDDCGQCGNLKREIRKQISAYKTLQKLEPNLNPDILLRNLERLVGNQDEEGKKEKRNPLSTIDTGILMEGESTCEIDGDGEMSDGGGGGEMISIYEVISPHRRTANTTTSNNFGCDNDEEEEMQIEDSGNHTGATTQDDVNSNELGKNNKKRQKPEDDGNEEEDEEQSNLLYQRPQSKRLKSSSLHSSHRASVIRTPLDLSLIQQHQNKMKKHTLKTKLRPKSYNSCNFNAGGSQNSNSSDDSAHQMDPGRNIKAALFTSDMEDDSSPFTSARSSQELESEQNHHHYSNLFSSDSERSTPSPLNNNDSSSSIDYSRYGNRHMDTIIEEEDEESQSNGTSLVCEKSVIVNEKVDDFTTNTVEPKQEVVDTEVPEQEQEEEAEQVNEEMSAEKESDSQLSEVDDVNMGLLDFSDMAKDFWSKEFINEYTINYFIRLHDIRRQFYLTSSKEEGRFVIQELKGLKEITTSILTLSEMSEKLRKNPIWFQRRIWIDTRGFDLFSSDNQNRDFFSLIRKSITHFSLGRRWTSFSELNDVQFLGFVYEELAPHLECLSVHDDVLTSWENVFIPFSVCVFPKLKTLRFYSSQNNLTSQFINQLLKTAPNLTSVYGFPLKYIKLLERKARGNNLTGKNLVKSLNLDFSPSYRKVADYEEDLSVLLKMKSCGLEEFQVPLFYPENQDKNTTSKNNNNNNNNNNKEHPLENFSYTELLQYNQSTIKKLVLKSQKKIRSFDWPVLNGCESLEFHVYLRKAQKNITPFFSKGFNVSARFPNVCNVEINFLDEDSPLDRKSKGRHPPLAHFKKYFPIDVFTPNNIFMSVSHLKLTNSIPVDCMDKLKTLFQNLKALTLHCNPSKLCEILPKVYNLWPQLEKLNLEVTHENISSSFILDPVFTGLSQIKCDVLRTLFSGQNSESQGLERSSNPLKMKDLKLLKITFVMPEQTSDDNKISFLLSDVSFRYALGKQWMPQLKILIFFDESCTLTYKNEIIATLEPIRQYVTIDGEM